MIGARLLLWLRILRFFNGLTIRSWLNLFVSLLVDIISLLTTKHIRNPKLLWPGLYLVKQYNFIIYVRGADDIYHALPRREDRAHDFIVSVLRSSDVFVDVGANIGYYTILGSKLVGSKG